jgi:hypothetical protein
VKLVAFVVVVIIVVVVNDVVVFAVVAGLVRQADRVSGFPVA